MASNMLSVLVIIRDIDNRGETVIVALQSKLKDETASWSQFITAAAKGTARAWIIVVTVSNILVTSDQADRFRV